MLNASAADLSRAKGISHETAVKLHRAAVQLRGDVDNDSSIRLEPGLSDKLVSALYDYDRIERLVGPLRARAEQYRDNSGRLRSSANPLRGRLRWILTGKQRKAEAAEALNTLTDLLQDPKSKRSSKTSAAPAPPSRRSRSRRSPPSGATSTNAPPPTTPPSTRWSARTSRPPPGAAAATSSYRPTSSRPWRASPSTPRC
ncbi:hypothetical protein ACFQ9X_35925 [Catenulispora yoronensis]